MRFSVLVSALAVAVAAIALTGCVSLTPEMQARLSGPVEEAAVSGRALLEPSAQAGNARAQLSWSLVLRYGLHGVTADADQAKLWRTRAVASRGSTTTAVWVPGYKKVPGHTQIMTLPKYDLTETEAQVAEACAALLDAPGTEAARTQALDKGTCGGAVNYEKLRPVWAAAKAEHPPAAATGQGRYLTGIAWMLPIGRQIAEAFSPRATADKVAGEVELDCAVTPDGRLSACDVVREAPEGYELGTIAARFFVAHVTADPGSFTAPLRADARTHFVVHWSADGLMNVRAGG